MPERAALATAAAWMADVGVVLPMDGLRLPLGAGLGWLLYGERVEALVIAGTACILLGNTIKLRASKSLP